MCVSACVSNALGLADTTSQASIASRQLVIRTSDNNRISGWCCFLPWPPANQSATCLRATRCALVFLKQKRNPFFKGFHGCLLSWQGNSFHICLLSRSSPKPPGVALGADPGGNKVGSLCLMGTGGTLWPGPFPLNEALLYLIPQTANEQTEREGY